MREYSTPSAPRRPGSAPYAGWRSLTDDVVRNAEEAPEAVVLSRPSGRGWDDVTAAGFRDEVVAVARGLMAAGVTRGDRVALMSATRYEWTLLDYACWWVGAVGVPVYETTRGEALAWVLQDSGARAVVVEQATHRAAVAEVRDQAPDLEHVWTIDADPPEEGAVAVLTALGRDVAADEVEARRRAGTPADDATLIYTSGTTGRPKGCRLTHANFDAVLDATLHELAELFDGDDAATLLFLPLPHVFARVVQVGCIRARVRLGHHAEVSRLGDRLKDFAPTFVLAVPRVFETVFNHASQRAVADGRGARFDTAVEVAVAWSRALDRGRVPLRLRARRAAADRMVLARLRESVGGRCRYAVSGGAPLGERLGHFFRGAGVTVLEGYGLSETTAAVTVGSPGAHKVGTVGRPLPGTTVRVSDDGELLFRGPQVFPGYWDGGSGASAPRHQEAEEATAVALDSGGWLHTGDLGEVDDEGFVRVTGRKQEILVTAGGKSVSPTHLEDHLRAHPLISQALVVGDRRPFVGALVTLDRDAVGAWARDRGKPVGIAALTRDPDLRREIQGGVDAANAEVSQAEAIRTFAVLARDWTEEGGELTPSLKLKRAVVLRRCKDDIAALYL